MYGLGPLTHRQYLVWHEWLEEEYNNPSRSDFYAMDIMAAIKYQGRRVPKDFKLKDLKITFMDKPDNEQPKLDRVQAAHISRSNWYGHVGKATVSRISKEEMARINALPAEEAMRERRRLAAQNQSPRTLTVSDLN